MKGPPIPTPKTSSKLRVTKDMKLPPKPPRPKKPIKGKIMKNSPLLEAFLKQREEPESLEPRPPPSPRPKKPIKGKIMKNSPLLEAFLKRREEPESLEPRPPPSPLPVGYLWDLLSP